MILTSLPQHSKRSHTLMTRCLLMILASFIIIQLFVGVVVEIEADVVHVDFNHPLAGLDLHFEGVVVAIGK